MRHEHALLPLCPCVSVVNAPSLREVTITSTANPLIKRLQRLLAQRKQRQAEGTFVVEGIRGVWQALESGADVELLVLAPDLLTSEPAWAMLEREWDAGRRVVTVSPAVYAGLAEREHPSGLAAVVRMTSTSLDALPVDREALFVGLYQVGNPGNLGTILRTLDAVGGTGLITIGDATDPYHPAAVRASMGALFTLPVASVREPAALRAWCREQGIGIVTTSDRAPIEHWSARYPERCLLLFGNEGEGLPEALLAAGDMAVRIPMYGGADSLNLAVAAGVLLYEVRRQLIPRKGDSLRNAPKRARIVP